MKALRESLKSHKQDRSSSRRETISTPRLPSNAHDVAHKPPSKVIRATQTYKPTSPNELRFEKGDFFHVYGDPNANGEWYQAHNPITGARGLVPKHMFEEFKKTSPNSFHSIRAPSQINFNNDPRASPSPTSSGPSPYASPVTPSAFPSPMPMSPPLKSPKPRVYLAEVLHDFSAERADELDAKAGDKITVVAQSNREWFVAKPIGRLGRPGLIPVAFVQVVDPQTGKKVEDLGSLMDRGELPRVEDWKKQMMNYKATSITLGVLDDNVGKGGFGGGVPNSPYMPSPGYTGNAPVQPIQPQGRMAGEYEDRQPTSAYYHNVVHQVQQHYDQYDSTYSDQDPRPPTPVLIPEGTLLEADVVSFHYEMDEYWFRVSVLWQPYPLHPHAPKPKAKQLVLFRSYNDFFDFQVTLLQTFPKEAGREPPHPRILPYMPGPADNVDEVVTATRQAELSEYVRCLVDISRTGAAYVVGSELVREFLSVKPGDVENEVEVDWEDYGYAPHANGHGGEAELGYVPEEEAEVEEGNRESLREEDLVGRMSGMRITEEGPREEDGYRNGYDSGYGLRYGDDEGSVYEEEPGVRHPSNDYSRRLHDRVVRPESRGSRGSRESQGSPHQPSPHHSRTDSAYHSRTNSPLPAAGGSHYLSSSALGQSYGPNGGARSARSSQNSHVSAGGLDGVSSPTSLRSHLTSSTRSRSQSNATTNVNHPSISSTNPSTAFVKIKIFDQVSDEVVAIRVHPRVDRRELVEKICARLASRANKGGRGMEMELRVRESVGGEMRMLVGDEDVREWIESADKHALYVD